MSEKPEAEVVEDKTRAAFAESGDPTPDIELAEKKRRAAVAESDGGNDRMIAALRRERDALVQQGKTDRVKEVDAQLDHYGHKPDGAKSEAKGDGDGKGEVSRKQAPQGRSTKPQQTGD